MARRVPNTKLRDLLTDSGWTYAALAHAVNAVAAENDQVLLTNKSTVEHWLAGAVPASATGRYLAEALSRRLTRALTLSDVGLACDDDTDGESIGLSLSGNPLDVLTRMWRDDVDRRAFVAASAYSIAAAALPLDYVGEIAGRARVVRLGAKVGTAEIAAVRDMVAMFTLMDERHGQHGRSAFVQYMRTDVATLCRGRFANQDVQRQMLSVAAAGVHLLAWKAYDAGERGLAQRYYLQCYDLATQSQVPAHDAFVLRSMAMLAMKFKRPEPALDLAAASVDRSAGKVDARTEALFAVTHAHTLARAGQRTAAISEVEHARAALASDVGDEMPFYTTAWGPAAATVHSRAAKVYKALRNFPAAEQQYAIAAAGRSADDYTRVIALDLVAAAEMQLAQGGIEQACATWGRAIDAMDGVQSDRTRKALTSMRRDLARFKGRGVRSATELDERALTILHAA